MNETKRGLLAHAAPAGAADIAATGGNEDVIRNAWSRIFKAASSPGPGWQSTDFRAIWCHHLSTPFPTTDVAGAMTPAGLLEHPSPPMTALVSLKQFAKLNYRHQASVFHPQLTQALYFLSLAIAEAKLGVSFSSQSKEQLREGFLWLAALDWIDARSRQVALDALRAIERRTLHGA